MKLIFFLLFPLFCFGQNITMEANQYKPFFINLPDVNRDSVYIDSNGYAPLIGYAKGEFNSGLSSVIIGEHPVMTLEYRKKYIPKNIGIPFEQYEQERLTPKSFWHNNQSETIETETHIIIIIKK